MKKYTLKLINGTDGHTLQKWKLKQGKEYLVGRQKNIDIVIDYSSVKKKHLKITFNETNPLVHSFGIVKVNEQEIERGCDTELQNKSMIHLGKNFNYLYIKEKKKRIKKSLSQTKEKQECIATESTKNKKNQNKEKKNVEDDDDDFQEEKEVLDQKKKDKKQKSEIEKQEEVQVEKKMKQKQKSKKDTKKEDALNEIEENSFQEENGSTNQMKEVEEIEERKKKKEKKLKRQEEKVVVEEDEQNLIKEKKKDKKKKKKLLIENEEAEEAEEEEEQNIKEKKKRKDSINKIKDEEFEEEIKERKQKKIKKNEKVQIEEEDSKISQNIIQTEKLIEQNEGSTQENKRKLLWSKKTEEDLDKKAQIYGNVEASSDETNKFFKLLGFKKEVEGKKVQLDAQNFFIKKSGVEKYSVRKDLESQFNNTVCRKNNKGGLGFNN